MARSRGGLGSPSPPSRSLSSHEGPPDHPGDHSSKAMTFPPPGAMISTPSTHAEIRVSQSERRAVTGSAAVYFPSSEAIQNVAKHARPHHPWRRPGKRPIANPSARRLSRSLPSPDAAVTIGLAWPTRSAATDRSSNRHRNGSSPPGPMLPTSPITGADGSGTGPGASSACAHGRGRTSPSMDAVASERQPDTETTCHHRVRRTVAITG